MCQNTNICILNGASYKRKGFLNIVEIKYKHLNKKVTKFNPPSNWNHYLFNTYNNLENN